MIATPLSTGERLVRCLAGEPVDRAPFGVGIGWRPWEQTLERWRRETGRPDLDPLAEIGADPDFLVPEVKLGMLPEFPREVVSEDREHVVYRDEKGILKRDRRDGLSMPEFLDYPVKRRGDWERVKSERFLAGDRARTAIDWNAIRARIEATGQAVQVGAFPYGVFGTARDLLGVELLLVSFYDDPDLVHDIMDHLTGLWIAVFEAAAREVPVDHLHIWEDMSGRQGSLISPAMVGEFMMPCYDRIAAFARAAGVRVVSVDTDGYCGELLELMVQHGVNTMLPFEVQAGNDIRRYRCDYPGLGIVGGLDKRALAEGRAAIDREVDTAAWMVKHGRYVPGFDHLIPPDVPWENYRYAADRLKEVCSAPGRIRGRR